MWEKEKHGEGGEIMRPVSEEREKRNRCLTEKETKNKRLDFLSKPWNSALECNVAAFCSEFIFLVAFFCCPTMHLLYSLNSSLCPSELKALDCSTVGTKSIEHWHGKHVSSITVWFGVRYRIEIIEGLIQWGATPLPDCSYESILSARRTQNISTTLLSSKVGRAQNTR